jgi:hypothetical protein
MSIRKQGGDRRGGKVGAVITALLAVVGAALITTGLGDASGPPPTQDAAVSPPGPATPGLADRSSADETRTPTDPPPGRADGFDPGPVLPGSRPVALIIPSINVHSSDIVGLGLAQDGTLEVPRDPSAPGWFTPGPSPGQFGPAVIAGHVDSDDGPAVFYRLGELRRGDQVKVRRQDRATAVFVVDRVHSYQKDRFPTRTVYGNTTDRAELRLITCSGEYDDKHGYLGNTVVFAHLKADTL